MIECSIKILTPLPIDARDFGRQLFAMLAKWFPGYLPQRYGRVEPLRKRFRAADLETVLESWGDEFFIAERDEPMLKMIISFGRYGRGPSHASVNFSRFQLESVAELPTLRAFVKELASMLRADYGMAHILTHYELEAWFEDRLRRPTAWPSPPSEVMVADMRQRAEQNGFTSVLSGVLFDRLYTVHLRCCLPSLYWLNIFGLPYVDVFGLDRILETPSETIEKLTYGGVAIGLTTSLPDTAESWLTYKNVRERCQKHLNSDVFCQSTTRKDYKYRAPNFFLSGPRAV
jgi:hypothetical protein